MFEKRVVLVPFTHYNMVEQVWASALKMAHEAGTEVIWLRVIPADQNDEECLFSELKGLQARLNRQTVTMHLQVEYGNLPEVVAQYREINQVDVVVMG